MKKVMFFLIVTSLLLCGCTRTDTAKTNSVTADFSSIDFSTVKSIILRNMHNGNDIYIEDSESVQAICEFLIDIKGMNGRSSKGYYEGTYELAMYESPSATLAILNNETPIFSIGFGDSDSFNFGEYGDGYPTRFELEEISIEEIISFLAQYDNPPHS